MTDTKIGPKRHQNKLETYMDEWVFVNAPGNGSIYGYINNVEGRVITFNPHKGVIYDSERDCNVQAMVKDDATLEISLNGYYIEKVNKNVIDCMIKKQNEEIFNELKKKDNKETKSE